MDKVKEIVKNIKTEGIGGIMRKLDDLGRIGIPIKYRKGKIEDGKTQVSVFQIEDYVIIELLDNQSMLKKRVDNLGRVVIDVEIRSFLNWKEGDFIEIWNVDKYFILKKNQATCTFCKKEYNNLINFKNKLICNKCKEELLNMKLQEREFKVI